ncbi:MAG: hypothetical protein AB8G05_13495 [Oligoflexales bacterium]
MKKFLIFFMVISICYLSGTKSSYAKENTFKEKIYEGILGTSILAGGAAGFLLGSTATLIISPIGVPVIILNPKATWKDKASMLGAIAGLPILGIPVGYYWGARLGLRVCMLIYGDQENLENTIEEIQRAKSIEDLEAIKGLEVIEAQG